MIAYKVVRREPNGNLYSAYLGTDGVRYHRNIEVYPYSQCGPLCVFNTIARAQVWAWFMRDDNPLWILEVWECEVKISYEKQPYNIKLGGCTYPQFPHGSVLASSVKLLRQIGE